MPSQKISAGRLLSVQAASRRAQQPSKLLTRLETGYRRNLHRLTLPRTFIQQRLESGGRF
jgi:hypothetical protein